MNPRPDIALYGKMAALKLGYVAGQIEVTSKCFQRCKHCWSWRNPIGEFTLEEMQGFFCQLDSNLLFFQHLTLTGGDPQAWGPIDKFLLWKLHSGRNRIKLQISTALAQEIENPTGWLHAVDDLRVSLDAIGATLYQELRGDKKNLPIHIVERTARLSHPNLSFIVTTYPESIYDTSKLLEYLDSEFQKGLKIRKIMVMIGLDLKQKLNDYFWKTWSDLVEIANELAVPTSFDDSIIKTREFCNSKEAEEIPCYASKLGFHIKANGSVFPCCLVGGEAIKTRTDFCMGNIYNTPIGQIYDENRRLCLCYKNSEACRKVCQYKQACINIAGHQAAKNVLAIP